MNIEIHQSPIWHQDALVGQAVAHICSLERELRCAFALQVGAWLFEHVFAADPACVAGRAGSTPTFAAIAADPRLRELGLRRSTLHNYVRLHIQRRTASTGLATALDQLSVSKQVRLLRVRDVWAKTRLAQEAVRRGWTVRELEAAIAGEIAHARAMAGHEVPGRKPLPEVVVRARCVIRESERLLELAGALDGLAVEERTLLAEQLTLIVEELAEL